MPADAASKEGWVHTVGNSMIHRQRARHTACDSVQGRLGVPNENEAQAVDARQELDLKVGVAFTRFQTRFFQVRTANQIGPMQV